MAAAVAHRRIVLVGTRAAWLALTLLMAGCVGIEPMAMPDNRENPEGPGILSGEDGEFVIYRR